MQVVADEFTQRFLATFPGTVDAIELIDDQGRAAGDLIYEMLMDVLCDYVHHPQKRTREEDDTMEEEQNPHGVKRVRYADSPNNTDDEMAAATSPVQSMSVEQPSEEQPSEEQPSETNAHKETRHMKRVMKYHNLILTRLKQVVKYKSSTKTLEELEVEYQEKLSHQTTQYVQSAQQHTTDRKNYLIRIIRTITLGQLTGATMHAHIVLMCLKVMRLLNLCGTRKQQKRYFKENIYPFIGAHKSCDIFWAETICKTWNKYERLAQELSPELVVRAGLSPTWLYKITINGIDDIITQFEVETL